LIRKVTAVVAHVVHGVLTDSYRYTTLRDTTVQKGALPFVQEVTVFTPEGFAVLALAPHAEVLLSNDSYAPILLTASSLASCDGATQKALNLIHFAVAQRGIDIKPDTPNKH